MNKKFFENLKYILRSYPVIKPYVEKVEALYKMNAKELKERNEIRFLQIFRNAYDKSLFYNQFYKEHGISKDDITCLEDIVKLPILTKDIVRQNAKEMLTVPKWAVISGCTSGTTGTPLRIYRSWPTIWLDQAYLYCLRRKYGFVYGEPLVSFRGNIRVPSLMVRASNTLYFSSYSINPQMVLYYYDMIKKFAPKAIEGYPSSLYVFALMLRNADLKLQIPLAFTSSETLLDYQRKLIQQQLGCEIFDYYGMTEGTINLAETIEHDGYIEAPGYSINEYVEDGEVCTSLVNSAFPLIRYKSNDLIELSKRIAPQSYVLGAGRIISRIVGRSDDYLVGKNGEICQRLNQIAKHANHCNAMQMIQREKGKVEILIVPDGVFSPVDEMAFIKYFEDLVGKDTLDYQVKRVSSVSDFVYTKANKFKSVVNYLNKV